MRIGKVLLLKSIFALSYKLKEKGVKNSK